MSHWLYQHPSDQQLSAGVTITPSTEDASYPTAGLYDGNPAKPFKLAATTGHVVFDFLTATSIALVALIHHNLDAGLTDVRIQGHTADDWTAPTLDEAFTIPAYERDGFPVNPWLDLSGAAHSYRYWRLVFGTANAVPIQLGQLWLGATIRELVGNIAGGFTDAVERRLIEHETDYGVSTLYDLGAKVRSWSPTLVETEAALVAVEQWWDACHGRALPTLVVPDAAVTDARLVRFASPARTITRHKFPGVSEIQFGLREVSRGLVL